MKRINIDTQDMREDIKKAGITQEELSRLIGKSRGYVSYILATGLCTLSVYKEICSVLSNLIEARKTSEPSENAPKRHGRNPYSEKRIPFDGQDIKKRVKQKYHTLKAFDEALGVPDSTFSDWIKADLIPESMLVKVNELLDMKPKKETGQIEGQININDFAEPPKTESCLIRSLQNICAELGNIIGFLQVMEGGH